MAEQRPTFRFRLPWLVGPPPAPRPPVETQTVSQPPTTIGITEPTTTTTPAQRPPFRPAGLAPVQPPPPPQAQAAPTRTESQPSSPALVATQPRVASQPASPSRVPTQTQTTSRPPPQSPQTRAIPRTESQPSSPSRVATQPRVASQPTSPSRVPIQSQDASQPPQAPQPSPQTRTTPRSESQPSSPSRLATQSRVTSQPASPSRAATTQPRAASQPPSPSRGTAQRRAASQPSSPSRAPSQTQPPLQTTTQPRSPSRLASQPPPSSIEPPPSVSQQEPQSQVPQPKVEITTETVEDGQNKTPTQTISQPNEIAKQSSKVSEPTASAAEATPEAPATTKKVDSSTVDSVSKTVPELKEKPEETKEEKEVVKAAHKEQPSIAFQAEQKQPEKQEIHRTNETLATSNLNGTHTKPVTSHSNEKTPVSESRQKAATSNGGRAPLRTEIREDISKFAQKMATRQTRPNMDTKPVSVITLAGENKGASMQLGSESEKREGRVHIHRGYKTNPDESGEATTDGEESSRAKRSKDTKAEEDQTSQAYINSNIQGINNSIVFNSSVTEKDPGVHMVLSHNITESTKSNNKTESETHKAEFNITPAQKLTYEPTVRRRCLRGLFMEPSDSDTDDPEKPRRHGCRYSCREKSKDNDDIDVL